MENEVNSDPNQLVNYPLAPTYVLFTLKANQISFLAI